MKSKRFKRAKSLVRASIHGMRERMLKKKKYWDEKMVEIIERAGK